MAGASGPGPARTITGRSASGSPRHALGKSSDPQVAGIRVEPRERRLAMSQAQQLRVTARYSDGREADVTAHAKFQSNNDGLAKVDVDGLVTAGEAPGDVAVMAAYMGSVAVFRAIVPRPGRPGVEPVAVRPRNLPRSSTPWCSASSGS